MICSPHALSLVCVCVSSKVSIHENVLFFHIQSTFRYMLEIFFRLVVAGRAHDTFLFIALVLVSAFFYTNGLSQPSLFENFSGCLTRLIFSSVRPVPFPIFWAPTVAASYLRLFFTKSCKSYWLRSACFVMFSFIVITIIWSLIRTSSTLHAGPILLKEHDFVSCFTRFTKVFSVFWHNSWNS